ncbi:MAG: hypothetical protein AMJ63_14500 [Myxococcales bacterium SG8_38_1]|nr:MAG: hypothetical protein AMJ63_14500 [Myxococcales bacterium SG8_38_1]
MRWFELVVAAALALSHGPSAQAEASEARAPAAGERWLVLPVHGAEADSESGVRIETLHTEAESLRHELSRRGKEVWRADRASERFEAVGSAPAPEVSQSDIDRWVERSRAAVRHLARADYKAARRELKAAQRLADRAAEELNREAARAQQVLDTCLFMVRAYVETKNSVEARRQARECRQLVPRVEPSAFRHTPEVRAVLAQVDAEIASEAPGTLEVTSTPPDCLVRINGVELGPSSGVRLCRASSFRWGCIAFRSNARMACAGGFTERQLRAVPTYWRSTAASSKRCVRVRCFTSVMAPLKRGWSAWITRPRWARFSARPGWSPSAR